MATGTRALVLGGGGVAGIAWELGLLTRLRKHGVDLAEADLVVGTSAGSVVGSILRGGDLEASHRSLFDPVDIVASPAEGIDLEALWGSFAAAARAGGSPQDALRRIGAIARAATVNGTEEESLARIQALLPAGGWPDAALKVTAVDAVDGSFMVFDAASGVPLDRAVSASCAVPGVYPTVTIGDDSYMDGGVRSVTNADVAAGFGRVVVVACSAEPPTAATGPQLDEAVAGLRESGDVFVIQADAESSRAFGPDSLSMTTRQDSANAGARQADAVAEQLRAFWR